MKNLKKLGAMFLALVMALAMVAPSFADEPVKNITIKQKEGSRAHTYAAYQIFSGTQEDEENAQLGNIEWGSDINDEAFLDALKEDETIGTRFAACESAADVAKAMQADEATERAAMTNDELRIFGKLALENMNGDGTTIEDGQGKLPVGYYVIKDTTPGLEGTEDAQNDIILQLTRDVTVEVKYNVPSSDKGVKDSNDTEGKTTAEWGKDADWDIGDKVPYQLKATLPVDFDQYETYYLQFVDKMSAGLTYQSESLKIYYMNGEDEVDITEKFTPNNTSVGTTNDAYSGGTIYTWTCEDLKTAVPDIPDGVTIYVEYTAELNENAKIGKAGNPNDSHIVFSNTNDGKGHGTTPDKTAIVFTYNLDVNKVDGDKAPLAGAEFALYKKVTADYALKEGEKLVYLNDAGEAVKTQDDTHRDGPYVEVTLTKNTDGENPGTVFTGKGLDDGTYKLVETKTPAGYNTADPVEFTVTAQHANGELKSIDGIENFEITLEPSGDTKVLETDIVNLSGLELPETGGIGTTIFYAVGGVLVIGAVVLLVTKKRVNSED